MENLADRVAISFFCYSEKEHIFLDMSKIKPYGITVLTGE